MKNNLFYSTVILLSACFFTACNNDNREADITSVPAVIRGKVYSFDVNAAAEQWKGSQMIGITMLKTNSTEYVEPYHNIKYKPTAYPIGYFTPVSTEDVLTYPLDGSLVDVVAYYPYVDDLKDNMYPMKVGDQTQTKELTFWYANNSKGLGNDNKKATLELRPVLSEIILKLLPGDGVTEAYLANPEIEVNGMYTEADFNLVKGVFEDGSMADMHGFVLPVLAADQGAGVSGKVFPIPSTQGCVMKITLSRMGRTYYWDFKELPQLKPGMRYICTVEIGLEKIEVTTTEVPITDWEDDENITGGGVVFAPEFIKTPIESLPLGPWVAGTGDVMSAPVDTWSFRNNQKMTAELIEDTDGGKSCVVLHEITAPSGVSSIAQYVAYRLPSLEPAIYTVSVRAKGSGNYRCYIKTGSNAMFVSNKLNTNATPYNGYALLGLTVGKDYQEFTFDFDCSHTVPSVYSYSEDQRAVATNADLAKGYFAIGANQVNTELYVYQISFKRKIK